MDDHMTQAISHLGSSNNEHAIKILTDRVKQLGDTELCSQQERQQIFNALQDFELGRWLIANQGGFNGYWTDYIVTRPTEAESFSSDLEYRLLHTPNIVASRERFRHHQELLTAELCDDICIISAPCGLMNDVLMLSWDGHERPMLIGIDCDEKALNFATKQARYLSLADHCDFIEDDIWQAQPKHLADVLICSGLIPYEADLSRIKQLLEHFATMLKPGGLLITNFVTPAPQWNMDAIDSEALRLSKIIFSEILQANWSNPRDTATMSDLLATAGFNEITINEHESNIFPTLTGRRI